MEQENIAASPLPAPTFLRSYDDVEAPATRPFGASTATFSNTSAIDLNLINIPGPNQNCATCAPGPHNPGCCCGAVEPLDKID